jgi:hypothetical protein
MQSGISRLLETLYFVQGKLESILKPMATPRSVKKAEQVGRGITKRMYKRGVNPDCTSLSPLPPISEPSFKEQGYPAEVSVKRWRGP